jgi:hypothetical protein
MDTATGLPTRTIETFRARSEHSQGGAQRSEQYLYGAQRAIESTCGRVDSLFKIQMEYDSRSRARRPLSRQEITDIKSEVLARLCLFSAPIAPKGT